jgi:hypothetical protein
MRKGIRIYKGQLPAEDIAELKEAYNGIGQPLFITTTTDNKGQNHDVIFRPIFHELYYSIQNLSDENRARGGLIPQRDIDEKIFDECLVWPEITPEERLLLEVQVIPTFSKIVQEYSGFTEVDVNGNWIGPNTSTLPIKDYDYWPDYTLDEVKQLKESVPFQLFRARIGKWIFIVRPLTTQDVRIAQTQTDSALTLARATVMWPEPNKIDWSVIPAGIVDTISNIATKVSGWDVGDVEIREI